MNWLEALEIALLLAAWPVDLAGLYLLLLALASRRGRPTTAARRLRFDLVVPAHDEERGVAGTVASLLAVDWPAERRRVVVVADNCADATAERAREAGATVLVRADPARRGKGYALAHAFAWSLAEGVADAVVVVDADARVTPNLLAAFAARLEAGADAVQADDAVGNPEAGWRPALMALAFVLFNTLRSLGRDRLGCSVGLRGTGMCLSSRVLREVPHEAVSEVEDLEYGLRLGEAGHRVRFAGEARVLSDVVVGASASAIQRRRWEGGRRRLARRHGWRLLRSGLAAGDRVRVDLGLDLLVPPLATLGALAALGAAAAWAVAGAGGGWAAAVAWSLALAALAAYVARGLWLSGLGLRGVVALLHAPIYLLWKVALRLRGSGAARGEWIRTPRERTEDR